MAQNLTNTINKFWFFILSINGLSVWTIDLNKLTSTTSFWNILMPFVNFSAFLFVEITNYINFLRNFNWLYLFGNEIALIGDTLILIASASKMFCIFIPVIFLNSKHHQAQLNLLKAHMKLKRLPLNLKVSKFDMMWRGIIILVNIGSVVYLFHGWIMIDIKFNLNFDFVTFYLKGYLRNVYKYLIIFELLFNFAVIEMCYGGIVDNLKQLQNIRQRLHKGFK